MPRGDTVITQIPWNAVRVGQTIACPVSGQLERVLRSEKRPGNRRFVRTDHHDHLKPGNDLVERLIPERI